MKRTRSRWLLNLAATGIGLAAAAGAGELVLRLFWAQRSAETIGMFRTDSEAGFRLQENYRNEIRTPEFRITVRTDSEGYRIPDTGTAPSPVPETSRRILAIGDSFTFGMGVNAEKAFPGALEERLGGAGWVVRNGGVGGYGPLRTAALFRSHQAAWRPRIVVHAFYVGNDFEDPDPATFRTRPEVRNGRMFSPGEHPLRRVRVTLRAHSHLYSFLRARLYGLYHRSGLSRRGQYLESAALASWPDRIRNVAWPAGQGAILEIRDWCRANGADYLVVLVPAKYQIDDASWESYRRAWDLPAAAFDRDHGQRVLFSFLTQAGVRAVDLQPEFRRRAREGDRLYFPVDRHWSPEGHELAAEIVARELEAAGWLVE